MVSTFHTLANRSLGCIPCLEPGRLRLPRRSSVSNTEYKSAVLSQASHALLASLLAINLHVANPADAKPEHTDYISVQDRTRQRSPLSSKPQNKDVFNEQSTALSISQQARMAACHAIFVSQTARLMSLYILQVAEVKRLSAEAALATDQNNFQQV